MGCTAREKHVRANRKSRSLKPEFDPCCHFEKPPIPEPRDESGLKPLGCNRGLNGSTQNSVSHSNPNASFDENGWGYCTEEQLEEILLKNLEGLYSEAIYKLLALGYDQDVAINAVLRNGYCYGGMDVLTNVLHNALAYLNSGSDSGSGSETQDDSALVFMELRQLEEYSLVGMVCLLQQLRPGLSKGDAMWCLLMSDLHVGRASSMEIPESHSSGDVSTPVLKDLESVGNNGVGIMPPALCRFHGGWGFRDGGGSELSINGNRADMTIQRDVEYPKRFNLSPSMKSLLKKNAAAFAAGFRANCKQIQKNSHNCVHNCKQIQKNSHSCVHNLSGLAPPTVSRGDNQVESCEKSQYLENQGGVNSMMTKLRALNLEENLDFVGKDQKEDITVTLLNKCKELEKQVQERKEWAQQKAMQAAKKLSRDLTELKMLKAEKEENQRLKKGKQTLEDSTMKRLSEMENALRKASGQVDRANACVKQLENENAEIRAELEAYKLSGAESIANRVEIEKREKKCLKRLLAWEKQKTKLQEKIADEKEKIKEMQLSLASRDKDLKETELKWRQELKAKDQAYIQVEEEQRAKDAAEASSKREVESLLLKLEIDFQRYKDDLQRLEQEYSRLKASQQFNELNHKTQASPAGKSEGGNPQKRDTIAKMLHELDLEDSSESEVDHDRDCIICMKDEVSVVFLPCAHQVLCVDCNDKYRKEGKATCPCCRAPIEQSIRVFGATS